MSTNISKDEQSCQRVETLTSTDDQNDHANKRDNKTVGFSDQKSASSGMRRMCSFRPSSKRVCSLILIILCVLEVCCLAQEDDSRTTECVSALITSEFDLMDFEQYGDWFNESSVMELAQSGTFVGIQDIREYVEFAQSSPFFDYYEGVGLLSSFPVSFTQDECIILFSLSDRMQVNAHLAEPACLETVVGVKVFFVTDPVFHIHRVNMFYPEKFLSTLFGPALDSVGVQDLICGVMENQCQGTFKLNNLTTNTCKSKYAALPLPNEEGYIDSDTKGCRILHAAFAATNEDHCAHISFVPQEDPKGRVKCQESKGVLPSDLFSADELAFLNQTAVDRGYPADLLFAECDYDPARASGVGNPTMTPSSMPISSAARPIVGHAALVMVLVGAVLRHRGI